MIYTFSSHKSKEVIRVCCLGFFFGGVGVERMLCITPDKKLTNKNTTQIYVSFFFVLVVNLMHINYYQALFLFQFCVSSNVEEILKKKKKSKRSDCEAHLASFKTT